MKKLSWPLAACLALVAGLLGCDETTFSDETSLDWGVFASIGFEEESQRVSDWPPVGIQDVPDDPSTPDVNEESNYPQVASVTGMDELTVGETAEIVLTTDYGPYEGEYAEYRIKKAIIAVNGIDQYYLVEGTVSDDQTTLTFHLTLDSSLAQSLNGLKDQSFAFLVGLQTAGGADADKPLLNGMYFSVPAKVVVP